MVGLSVILENFKDLGANKSHHHHHHQVICKGSMIKSPSNPSSPNTPINATFSRRNTTTTTTCSFLDSCFLCNKKLMPGKDIYMYKGDKGFCSVECRCRQIFMDEEESSTAAKSGCTREYNNCSLAATSSTPSSSRSRSGGKGGRNRANNNAFAY